MSNSSFYSAEEDLRLSPNKSPPKQEPQARHNPFEVIYDSSGGSSPTKNQRPLSHTDEIRHSQIYQDIEYSMSNQLNPSPPRSHVHSRIDQLSPSRESNVIRQSHPIITVVDAPQVKRSGSIVSSSASLRSRNRIKSRTKIARRKELQDYSTKEAPESSSEYGSKKNKKKGFFSQFQFPVKRTTSLKRKPSFAYNSLGQSVPNFHQKSDFDKFIDYCFPRGSNQLLADILPKQLKFYEFKQLILSRRPDLIGLWKNVDDTDLATATCATLPTAPPKVKKAHKVEIIESAKPKIKRSKSKTKPKGLHPQLKSIIPSRKSKVVPLSKKRVTISSPIKESFTHNGVNPYITTTAAAAVAEAAAASATNRPINTLNKQKDYPLELDIVTNTDPDSIPMTLDPTTSKMGGINSAQLSPGTIAAVIAAAGMSSLNSSLSPAPTLPPSLSPPVSGNNPYSNFRNELFNSQTVKPIPYATMFPDTNSRPFPHLTRKDISQMNRTLFLEVLLRRTISAKIDYRLKTYTEKRLSSNELDTDSSSKSETTQAFNDRYNDIPKLSSSEDSDTDDDSINTNDLIEHNASLLSSELLPSPQISYSTDLFGKLGAFDLPHLDQLSQKSQVSVELIKKWTPEPVTTPPRDHQLVDTTRSSSETVAAVIAAATASQRTRSGSISGNVLLRSSGIISNPPTARTRSVSTPISAIPQTLQPAISTIPETRSFSTNRVLEEDLFINDFNKTYFAQYGPQNKAKDNTLENSGLKSNMYQLKPLNRSAETLSSSEESEKAPVLDPTSSNDTNSGSHSHSNSNSNSTQLSSHSNSHVTANTTASSDHHRNKKSVSSAASIGLINDLDDMASRISTFMQEEFNFPSPQQRPEQLQPLVFSSEISLLQGLSPSSTTKQQSPNANMNSTPSIQEKYPTLKPESTIRWERSVTSTQRPPQQPVSNLSYILRSDSVEVFNPKTPHPVVHQQHPSEIKSLHGSISIAGASAMSEISRSDGSSLNPSPESNSSRYQAGHRNPQIGHTSNKSFYSTSSRYESSNEM
ncbi:hypothetical protein CLIB1423_09S03862 [[Candida] railenensis]|uniref:Uncharacterized protein n=1 Tax=[Candida] railenensis TaxID=45579 RepID=A0A9P0QQP8_9ASCO|nr:hypothetical protein CLIB1423_09S03862 [[Candida] railenensis]